MDDLRPAIEGKTHQVFVCYSHADNNAVYSELAWLKDAGQQLWYDEGIEPGQEWSDEIADAISNSSTFLYFISPNSVASEHCRRELNYALDRNIDVLAVHLLPTQVERGLALSLSHRQAIFKHKLTTEKYRGKLLGALTSAHTPFSIIEPESSKRVSPKFWVPLIVCTLIWVLWNAENAPEKNQPSTCTTLTDRIAVLPFDNASGDIENLYKSEGFSDALRDQLSNSGLSIVAAFSSRNIGKFSGDPKKAAAGLNASFLITGSLNQQADKYLVSTALVDGCSGTILWSRTYSEETESILQTQQHIAERIVQYFSPAENRSVAATTTSVADANELMWRAAFHERKVRSQPQVDVQSQLKAIELYREATVVDPDSALAHSRLAAALFYLGDFAAAEKPMYRALSLNNQLSEVHYTLGLYYQYSGQPGAGAAYERALSFDPNNPDALAASAYWIWMQQAEGADRAERLYRMSLELDPLNLARYSALGSYLGHDGQERATKIVISRVQELFNDVASYLLVAWLYELTGELDHSIAWTIKAREIDPDYPFINGQLADRYAEIGDFDTALALEPEPLALLIKLHRYEDLVSEAEFLDVQGDIQLSYLMAFAYNATGRFEQSIEILEYHGLPGLVINGELRQASDVEASLRLMDAYRSVGRDSEALEIAQWIINHTEGRNIAEWWGNTNMACAMIVAGNTDGAVNTLELIMQSNRLAFEWVLKDSPCFQHVAEEPRYQTLLNHYTARRALLLKRLPDTLAEYGVNLEL